MSFYACLYVSDFPAAVLLRGERNLQVPSLVVYTGTAPNCFVFSATQPARAGGVKEGMPLAEATARLAASQIAKSPPPKEPSRDEGKGRGIRPYRLRPTAPLRIGGGESSGTRETQGTRKQVLPGTQGTACRAPTFSGAAEARNNGATEQRNNEDAAHGSRFTVHGTTEKRSNEATEQWILPRDSKAEQQTQRELLELALTISPRVEDTAPGVIMMELTGLPDPHGAAGSFSHQVESLGLPANVAVSRNRFVALCAARTQTGVTHIYPGQEAGFLHPLPLDVLPLDRKEQETFGRWGIRTIGELARLPQDSLVARFGARGGQLAKLARGQEDSLLRAYETPPVFEESMDFEWQVAELEPLSFLLSRLLDSLCLKLQGHGLAAEQIQIALKLADGSRFERAVSLPSPLNDRMVLLSLLQLDLMAHPPGEAIEGVKVAARPTPLRRVQFSLFEPALPSPEKLAVTLARLANLVGRDRVGAPVVVDTHRPGAFDVAGFAPQTAGIRRWTQIDTDEEEPTGVTRNRGQNGRDKGQGTRDKKAATGTLGGTKLLTGNQSRDREGAVANPSAPQPTAATQSLWVAAGPRKGGVGRLNPPKPTAATAPRSVTAEQAVRPSSQFPAQTNPGTACRAPTFSGATEQRFNGSTAHGSRLTVHEASSIDRRSLAFRCFRPPPPAEVILRGKMPVYVNSGEIQGSVRTRAGPWKVCGEWWIPEGWQYEEWDVEVQGRLYRICCELPTGSWFVTGVYD